MLRSLLISWLLFVTSSCAFVAHQQHDRPLVSCFSLAPRQRQEQQSLLKMSSSSSTTTITKPEIEVVHQPDQEFLEKKGVFNWGTWGCDAGSFPWSYSDSESCYLLQGKVTVTPTDGRQAVTFGKGDFVTFPAGMSCQWDVAEPVKKHFNFF